MNPLPHLRVIIGACIAAVAGYAVFSAYAVLAGLTKRRAAEAAVYSS